MDDKTYKAIIEASNERIAAREKAESCSRPFYGFTTLRNGQLKRQAMNQASPWWSNGQAYPKNR